MVRRRQWGSGEVFQEPSGAWAFRWRERGHRRYSGGHPSKELAQRALAKIQGDLASDRAGLPRDPRNAPRLADVAPDFLDRRERTHRAGAEDRSRWNKHLGPHFGHLRPGEVGHAEIREFVETKRGELASGTVRICVSLLSSLFEELIEKRLADANPARGLPRSLRRLVRPDYDPRTTPFIERLEDVRRVYLRLEEPLNVAFAIGALGGLRTGEVFALRWRHVDLKARRIHVRESVNGPLKDKDSRIVPILAGLDPVLTEWRLRTGGVGLVVPPLRRDGEHIDKATPALRLRPLLRAIGLEVVADHPKAWYCATRHTFASQWVMAGGSIEKLKEILGHYSVVMTERYAHLKPEFFRPSDHETIPLDLRLVGAEDGQQMASDLRGLGPK